MRLLWGAALRTAISLFTGVGGLDFGLEAAGFSTAVALECDAVACSTILLNRKWPVIKDDARRSAVELLQAKRRIYPRHAQSQAPHDTVGSPVPRRAFSLGIFLS